MASQSKCKTSVIHGPDINWREISLEGSSLILSVVKEAATLAPIAELKKAACSALLIFKTTQVWTCNINGSTCLGLILLFIDSDTQGKQRGIRTTWLPFERPDHCNLALV